MVTFSSFNAPLLKLEPFTFQSGPIQHVTMKSLCLFLILLGWLGLNALGQNPKRRVQRAPRTSTPAKTAQTAPAKAAQASTPVATAEMYNVREDFAAVGDGVADDTEALRRAVQAGKTGKPVFLPAGTYRVDWLNLSGRVTLVGEGLSKSILKSTGANRAVVEVTDIGSGVTVRDIQILGTATAQTAAQLTRQHGFHQYDQEVPGISLDRVLIKNVGGNGVRLERAFSLTLLNVETDFTYRDAFDIISGGPNITIINSYVHSLGSPNTAAYRLRAGRPVLINANGIDGPQRDDAHTTWAVVGQTIGFGDPRDSSAFPTFINPNIESFTDFGIVHLETSTSNLLGAQIFPHSTARGVEPLRYNGGSGGRGVIDTATVICCDRSRYRDGREIRAYGAAPIVLLGAVGVFQGFDGVTDYFNFETGTIEPLRRIDDWLTRREVTGSYTMKTTETKLIDVRAVAPATITLMSAAAAREGASITVKDGAGNAQINRILINAQGSRIDGANEQVINSSFGALTFYSDGQNWLTLRPALVDDPRNRPTTPDPRRNFLPRASGLVRLDFRFGNIQHLVLQGDVTVTALANLRDGASYTFIFEQDGSGGRALTLSSAFKFSGGLIPRWSVAPGARDVVRCDSDGANLYCRADLDVK